MNTATTACWKQFATQNTAWIPPFARPPKSGSIALQTPKAVVGGLPSGRLTMRSYCPMHTSTIALTSSCCTKSIAGVLDGKTRP